MSQKRAIGDERSVASNSSATTNQERGSLPGYVSKALAELLEANGGIRTFSGKLSQKLRAALDNSSSDTFGEKRRSHPSNATTEGILLADAG